MVVEVKEVKVWWVGSSGPRSGRSGSCQSEPGRSRPGQSVSSPSASAPLLSTRFDFYQHQSLPLVLIYPQTDAEIPEFTKKPHRYRSLPPMCKIKRIGWVSFIYKQMDTSLHICCYTVHLITYLLLYCTPYYISSILLIEV